MGIYWNDIPYKHNAGRAYDEFIDGYVDIGFDIDTMVLEPCNGYMNNTFSKGRFQEKKGAGNNYQKAE